MNTETSVMKSTKKLKLLKKLVMKQTTKSKVLNGIQVNATKLKSKMKSKRLIKLSKLAFLISKKKISSLKTLTT